MKTIKKTIGWSGLAVAAVLFLVSCGGSSEVAGLEGEAACGVSSAKPGESVTCSAKGFEDGCTVFVGNTPVDALGSEEGEITFELPKAPAGFVDILYGCGGDEPQTIQKKFQILPYFDDEGGNDDGSGDVILPENPEAPLPEEPEDDGPVTPGKDLVVGGELSAGTGGGAGAVVSLAGTEDVHETNVKMTRIRWKIPASDVEEAYIHAAFNRKALDGNEEDPCGRVDGRFLAVNGDGNDFNEGSADADAAAPYLTGKKCHNNADCAGLSAGNTPAADVGLKANTNPTQPQRVASPKAPVCKIDLKSFLDEGVTEGEFDTLSHQKELRIVLVAKLKNGNVVKDERTWTAPRPVFTDVTVKVLEDQQRVSFNIAYERAVNTPRLYQCANKEIVFESHDQKSGSGAFRATCAIRSVDRKIDVILYGIGTGNYRKKTYRVLLKAPQVSLKLYGSYPGNNQEGNFQLQHEAVRDFEITHNGEVVASGQTSWFKGLYFDGFPSGNGHVTINDVAEVNAVKDAYQDPSHLEWTFGVKDFDGTVYKTKYTSNAFPTDFGTSLRDGGGGMEHPDGSEVKSGECNRSEIRITHLFDWEGTNVKKIEVTSDQDVGIDPGDSDMPDGKYGFDAGHVKVYRDLGKKNDTWDENLSFTFKVTFHDGTQSSKTWNVTGWTCH